MITALELHDFKNFADETLSVGPFTVIVGANASGKSNIRDAFRILHGIGRGYALADIIGGKYGAGGHVEWEQIRGAASEISRFEVPGFALLVYLTSKIDGIETEFRYTIWVLTKDRDQGGFQVGAEILESDPDEQIYSSNPLFSGDNLPEQDDDRHLQLRMARTAAKETWPSRRSTARSTGSHSTPGRQASGARTQGPDPGGHRLVRQHAFSRSVSGSHPAAIVPRTNHPGRQRREPADRPAGNLCRSGAQGNAHRVDPRADTHGHTGLRVSGRPDQWPSPALDPGCRR